MSRLIVFVDEGTLNWPTVVILLCLLLTVRYLHILNASLFNNFLICWVLGSFLQGGGGVPCPLDPVPLSPGLAAALFPLFKGPSRGRQVKFDLPQAKKCNKYF